MEALRYTVPMATASPSLDAMIQSRPGVQGGQPCVAGTGVTVYWLGLLATREGLSPQEIRDDVLGGTISLAQIRAALAYYLVNRAEIDADVAERDRISDEHAALSDSYADRPR